LAGGAEVPPLPSPFAPRLDDVGLQAAVVAALAGREGEYSVVVQNLADGRYAALNDAKIYYAASLYKLELLLEAYRQRDATELDFARLLTLEKEYVEYDLGTLESLGLHEGDMITVADALRAMIVVSDTPTAVMMHDVLGPLRVDATLQSLGIIDTESANHDLPATARDMARLLGAVAVGEGVSEASRLEMLSLLLRETYAEGVRAGVPIGTAVAHKTGSYNNATHDVALVWGPDGPYVIAVMTDRSYDWDAIRAVSEAVWAYFAASP
jgi:beta-lactamase class A